MTLGTFQSLQVGIAEPHVGWITLARPDAQNALDVAMCQELVAALTFAAQTPDVRVVVVAAAGPVFCSGGEHRGAVPAGDGTTVVPVAAVLQTLHQLPVPTVAMVQGRAHGAGLALALACDYTYCTEDCELAVPDIRFGLWGMHVMPYLLRVLSPKKAYHMLATGLPLRGKEAEFAGLVTRATAAATIDKEVRDLARKLAGLSPSAMRAGTAAFRRVLGTVEGADAAATHAWLQVELDKLMATADAREAQDAIREGRQPSWRNA